jgi:hypothetical protein
MGKSAVTRLGRVSGYREEASGEALEGAVPRGGGFAGVHSVLIA